MATLPIIPVVLPSTLKGLQNGKLTPSVLMTFALDDGDVAVCEVTASRAFRAMFAQARIDLSGLRIRDVGGYRSYAEQLSLFLSRYNSVSLAVYNNTLSAHRKYWASATSLGYSSVYWVKKSNNLATAAVPGASNHGWGLAIDIAENLDTDYAAEGITARFVTWLIEHAIKYGISAELQSEPWHWRYVAGDNVPRAVLEYEGAVTPPNPKKDLMEDLPKPIRVYDSRVNAAPAKNYPGSGDSPLNPGQSRTISIPYAKQNADGTGGMEAVEINLTVITDGAGDGHVALSAGDVTAVEHADLSWNSGERVRNMQMRVRVDHKTGLIRVHCGPERVMHLIVDWKASQALTP